jgi:HTH-type transcriptional regulator/antitoxin HigA
MKVKPIRSERDYRQALKEIERLMDARAGTAQGDRLDVLATLVEAWEKKHHAIEAPDPIEAIRFAMEQRGLKRRDLEPLIGSRARVAEVLNRRRALTLPMIRRLHLELGIPAESLIGESRTTRAA